MADRRLWLIRHAKSDWVHGVPDFQRDLNDRGRRDGPIVARWLRLQPKPAQWIWTSTAKRAMATALFVAEGFRIEDEHVAGVEALYLASSETALDVLRGTPPDVESVAMVFHNPGITDLVNLLSQHQAIENLPTLGVAEFSTKRIWSSAHPHDFKLERIMTPKGLRAL